ncbi:MAG: RcnB family protein [Novosphingobium sp.]|jgi:Ni/Co efflux regulator RcnB|nr:RcnB family protein [Novosphingobium sp.]
MKKASALTAILILAAPVVAEAGAAPQPGAANSQASPGRQSDRRPGTTRPPQRPNVRPPHGGSNTHRPPVRPPHRPGAGRPPSFRPIPGGPFRFPRGFSYRRWHIGLFLPSLFLSPSHFYNRYFDLGLGAPPAGYRWVRYGPDLLLVHVRTRRIVDVIYGAFY